MATSRKGAGKIKPRRKSHKNVIAGACLLYTSDAADDLTQV